MSGRTRKGPIGRLTAGRAGGSVIEGFRYANTLDEALSVIANQKPRGTRPKREAKVKLPTFSWDKEKI